MPLDPGSRLGTYEILSQLGQGGMGIVFRARDTRLDRVVAVKVLPKNLAEDRDALERFEREAKVVAAASKSSKNEPAHRFPRALGNPAHGRRFSTARTRPRRIVSTYDRNPRRARIRP
jgi:serine/threonine protein kinase